LRRRAGRTLYARSVRFIWPARYEDFSEGHKAASPTFRLNPEVTDFCDFTPDDAVLADYRSNPQIKGIPVAVQRK
jgi:hypothetical protein